MANNNRPPFPSDETTYWKQTGFKGVNIWAEVSKSGKLRVRHKPGGVPFVNIVYGKVKTRPNPYHANPERLEVGESANVVKMNAL